MKIKACLSFALLLLGAPLFAAPLTSTTAVHTKPSATSPVITVLSAGTEPTPAVGIAAPLPSGWSAIELGGAQEAYVLNRDLNKELDVRIGAEFHTLPKPTAPVIGTMQSGDQVEITGYHGKWTQVKLNKKVVGYIQGWTAGSASSKPATAIAGTTAVTTPSTPPATIPRPTPTPAPFSAAPSAPAAVAGGGAGHPAQMVNLGDGGSSSLPRVFQGKFVSTRSLLHPRRPYDYQLNDSAGARFAYLDISRLLQTEQIEKYLDHTVSVYGTAKAVPDSKDIVIEVESLQLR